MSCNCFIKTSCSISPRVFPEDELNLDDSQWEDIRVVTGALKMFFSLSLSLSFPPSFSPSLSLSLYLSSLPVFFTRVARATVPTLYLPAM